MQCSQCARQAMYDINGHLLCLEHRTMLVQSAQQSQRDNMAMMNYLRDQINETFGLPPSQTRIQVPQDIINHAPVTYNHINVSDSVVGSINTAQVGRIDVAMNRIANGGNEEVANAIKSLTEAVLSSKEVDSGIRDQLIEQLSFLAEQAVLPKAQQQKSVIGIVLETTATTIGAIASLSALWTQWGAVLASHFAK